MITPQNSDNSKSKKTRAEITQKRARIAFLQEFIFDNQLPAFHNVEAGFFTAAAEKFQQMKENCEEITALEQSIQQLEFALEKINSEQTEFRLAPA